MWCVWKILPLTQTDLPSMPTKLVRCIMTQLSSQIIKLKSVLWLITIWNLNLSATNWPIKPERLIDCLLNQFQLLLCLHKSYFALFYRKSITFQAKPKPTSWGIREMRFASPTSFQTKMDHSSLEHSDKFGIQIFGCTCISDFWHSCI